MAKDNVIYISSHNIQIIKGSCEKNDMIKIYDFESYEIGEGAMINGVITDETMIKDTLQEIKDSGVSEAKLVIDSGQIIVKNVNVPFMSKKELKKVTKDELADIDGSYQDLIYDYSVLRPYYEEEDKKGGEILCCAVERKLISSYVELFESCGIKLKSIDISVNALHKLTQELADLEDMTYIVSIVDGNNVSSFLFEKNHYTFSNRTRLFSERKTDAFISEMVSNISQLIQFNKSKQSPYSISTAFFCGLDDDEEDLVFQSVSENLKIKAKEFPNSKIVYAVDDKPNNFLLHDYVFPVGCLIRK